MSVQYLYSVARVRYKETTLMDKTVLDMLLGQKDIDQILSILNARGWNTSQGIEKMIEAEYAGLRDEINELAENDMAINAYLCRNDYHNLKAAIKKNYASQKNINAYMPENLNIKMLKEAAYKHDFTSLPEEMQTVAAAADEAIGKYHDPFLCDAIIDKAAIETMYALAEKSASSVAKLYAKDTLVKAAVKIALRRAGMSTPEKNALLIPECGIINAEMLVKSAEAGDSAVIEYLKSENLYSYALALEKGFDKFEDEVDNAFVDTIRPQKYVIDSVDPIFAYMLAKENEIRNVFMILRAVQGGIEITKIKERLRESYV